MKIKKIYKKGIYPDRYIIDKITSPLFEGTRTSIGIGLTIGRIIKEKLLVQDLTNEDLLTLKELGLNPDIPFMMRAITDNPKNAICFMKEFGYSLNDTDKNNTKNSEIVLELIKEKHKLLSIISK